MKKYICSICGYIYDDKNEKVNFEDLPDNWKCPLCGAPKSAFNEVKSDNKINTDNKINVEVQSEEKSNSKKDADKPTKSSNEIEDIKELSFGELSAICSNLAKGCEKQYLFEESGLFTELADYYKNKVKTSEDVSFDKLIEMINGNLNNEMSVADGEAERYSDRGAKRVLTWSRKVTTILKSLLERYQSEGSLFIEKTNVYVCSICGFIYIGEEAPEVCPICKVPKLKFIKVGRNI